MKDMTSPADLTLMLTTDAKDWGAYVTSQLKKFPRVSHATVLLEEQEYENPPEITLACKESPVILLLATFGLLDFMKAKQGWFPAALRDVPTHNGTAAVIVVSLLDSKKELDDVTTPANYVTEGWRYEEPGQNASEVIQMLARVLDVIEQCKAVRERLASEDTSHQPQPAGDRGDGRQAAAGASPAKVAPSPKERKILPSVPNKPTSPPARDSSRSETRPEEGAPKVADRAAKPSPSAEHKGPKSPPATTPRPSKTQVHLIPSQVYESDTKIAIVFNKDVQGELEVKVDNLDLDVKCERLNSATFAFNVPDLAPGKYSLALCNDGKRVTCGVLELTVRGADEAFFTSPHYLRQALGLKDLQELDEHLQKVFNASVPSEGLETIFSCLPQTESDGSESQSISEFQYPTMLHYAAAHGLSELCGALLDCPGSSRAFNIRNKDGSDPMELAAEHGFKDLSDYIKDFMDMQSASCIYEHYLAMNPIAATEESSSGSESDDEYERMDRLPMLEQTPPSRDRTTSEPCPRPPALPPRPMPDSNKRHMSEGDGSPSRAALPDRAPALPPRIDKGRTKSERHHRHTLPTVEEGEMKKSATLPAGLSAQAFMGMTSTPGLEYLRPPLPKGAMGSRSQSELIELNEMVKNKEINLDEAQMLYKSWQQRHIRNSSMSFKQRQVQLTGIKDEYMQLRELQQKTGQAKPSFLERFGRKNPKKSTIKLSISDPVAQRQTKSGTRVYTKQQGSMVDRDSTSSNTSSGTCSSRDSGWSAGSRDSNLSNVVEDDDGNDVFYRQESVLRRIPSSGSMRGQHRESLGKQFLHELETAVEMAETSGQPQPPLPPRSRPPHPLPCTFRRHDSTSGAQ